jgi:recombinational DNA repair protein (RecF pathway)
LIEYIVRPDQASGEVFSAVRTAMAELAQQTEWSLGRRWLALDRFAYQLLLLEGFVPAIDHCPRCARPMPGEAVAYDPLVGFVHGDEAPPAAVKLTPKLFSFLETGQTMAVERTIFRQLHPLLETMIAHTIERPLKSERVLRAVFRQARLSSADQYGMIDGRYAQSPSQGANSGVETTIS